MHYPSREEFRKLSRKSSLIPVYRELTADCETPVSTFLKLAQGQDYAYLLESVEGGERWGRYSFISWDPRYVFTSRGKSFDILDCRRRRHVSQGSSPDPLSELEKMMKRHKPAQVAGLPRFWGGAVGFIGYEMVQNYERIPDTGRDELHLPDSIFLLNDVIIVFDHLTHKTKVVACVDCTDAGDSYSAACRKIDGIVARLGKSCPAGARASRASSAAGDLASNMTAAGYMAGVRKMKGYIRAGDIIQGVLSQRFSKRTAARPFDIYRCLRMLNPSPYMYYLKLKGFCLIGSSPEILVRKEGSVAELRPIAGTCPRGKNEAEEKKLIEKMRNSPKERAEHIMLVDLGRNDLGRVSQYGSVKVSNLMAVEKYSHVAHLVSSVTGTLRKGVSAFGLLAACFPAGTVSGAPKIRAMEIISELEPSRRGAYAGAVGYFSYTGNMDMAINIRTILYKGRKAYMQAGAGIVADSDPAREYQETRNKAKALFIALEQAEKGIE